MTGSIVHIGLGKTATTTLQRHVFPLLAAETGYTYNDRRLRSLLAKSVHLHLDGGELQDARDRLAAGRHLVSIESLVGDNPAYWERAADRNLSILGQETTVLLTLREPHSWLTSIYQQKVHEGNVYRPEQYFLARAEHEAMAATTSVVSRDYFSSDDCDFRALAGYYSDRFARVAVVEMSRLPSMDFLSELFELETTLKAKLSAAFVAAPRENRAYSASAMRLTFLREDILRACGLKSLGSSDRRLAELGRAWKPPQSEMAPGHAWSRSAALAVGALLHRVVPTYRGFMQRVFDKVIPNRRYVLPETAYVNRDLIQSNRDYIAELNARASCLVSSKVPRLELVS